MKQLNILRKQIDEIDKKLIVLLAQRAAVSKKIGDSKKKHNKPVLDAKRWKTVLQTRIQQAEIHDLPANFIKKIFTLIHNYSQNIQNSKQ